MIEFFNQGDKEAEMGLPVSPFMDRHKTPLSATIVNCQIGFINVLVRPLLAEWSGFLGDAAERDIIYTLDATLRLWETQGQKVIESWGDFAQAGTGLPAKDSKHRGSVDKAKTGTGGKGGAAAATTSTTDAKQTV